MFLRVASLFVSIKATINLLKHDILAERGLSRSIG
jgi:hypothetical protein